MEQILDDDDGDLAGRLDVSSNAQCFAVSALPLQCTLAAWISISF